jgi:foldase protein PrsA
MKKKLLILLACLLLVSGCKDVKLDNGENAIVTFKEGGISSQDLYKVLKERYSGDVIADVIDSYLLNKLYETTSEEKDYVNQAKKTIKETADQYGLSYAQYIKAYFNLPNEDALNDYLSLNYKRNMWVQDYAKETVTDKQINEYYDNYYFGDIEASQILITVDVKENATDEEKAAAEKEAEKTANEIITKLKNGEDFAKLAKTYSKDETSANNGGSLGKVNTGDLPKEALEALRGLKDGSYTVKAVKSSEGYHILYRTSMDAKKELNDEVKDEIRSIIGAEIEEEEGFSAKAILALREKNEMTFVDTDIEKQYKAAGSK